MNYLLKRYHIRVPLLLIIFFLTCTMTGCSLKESFPDKKRWTDATIHALKHPGTWTPLAGASIIAIGGWDQEISNYATSHTPVFGSQEAAGDASDTLRTLSSYGMVLSALGAEDNHTVVERLFWNTAGVHIATEFREVMSRSIGRERPNGEENGMPSRHATRAFAYSAMTSRNIDAMRLSSFWEYSAKTIETSFAVGTAWARVEAGNHYPTDVLVAASLANFISLVTHDLFLGHNTLINLTVNPEGTALLQLNKKF